MKLRGVRSAVRFFQLDRLFRGYQRAADGSPERRRAGLFQRPGGAAEIHLRWPTGRPISLSICCTRRPRCCRRSFRDENFAFYGKYLTGEKEQKPRWKRCVAAADGDLGEALGKAYVDQTFGAEGKQRTLDMVHDIEQAMGQDLNKITWMTPATKTEGARKAARHHQ